ncbi:hypothetical protein CASFOL_035413 [Castilleja foliolosa]|uniref:FBD domain-containing protein n=1 Tax=Castilleja foliolosa TaxID=1961234 RepID=A0ABD3BU51_9LAMI
MLWQFRWTQSPRLVFGKIGNWIPEADVQDLVSRVNRTLVIYGRNDLDTFELEFPYSKSYSPDVNVWAASNYVSECIPETAEVVGMHCGNNRVAVVDRATHQESELQQHVMDKMLSGRPVLRCLILLGFRSFGEHWSAEVMSNAMELLEKVRHVKVVDLRYGYIKVLSLVAISDYRFPQSARTCLTVEVPTEECSIHVLVDLLESSPNLETSNNFFGALHLSRFKDWSGLVDARNMSNTKEILEIIRHVKVVDLRYGYIKVLFSVAITDYRFPQSAPTCLSVEALTEDFGIHALVGLLESSPNLEALVLKGSGVLPVMDPHTCIDSKLDLDCDLLHLKSIIIKEFTDKTLDGEPMLILARILLNKAPALEKMVVHDKIFIQSPSRYRKHY